MRLVLIRHSIRQDVGDTDCSITEEGIRLVDDRAEEIMKYVGPNPDILTSPFRRAVETAMCLARRVKSEITIDPILHETLFHRGMTRNLPASLTRYISQTTPQLSEGFETWASIGQRCRRFLANVAERDRDVVAVSHGGIINTVLALIDPTYRFDTQCSDPTLYVPRYCDYLVLETGDVDDPTKWTIVHRNF